MLSRQVLVMDVTTTWRGYLLGYWDHKMRSKNPCDRNLMRCEKAAVGFVGDGPKCVPEP